MTLIDLSGNTTDGGPGDGDGVLRAAEQVGWASLVVLEGREGNPL